MKKWTELVTEAKMNNKDYVYYLLNGEGTKIETGWEYREDADDEKKATEGKGKILRAPALRQMGLDPNDNKSWERD